MDIFASDDEAGLEEVECRLDRPAASLLKRALDPGLSFVFNEPEEDSVSYCLRTRNHR